MPSGAAHAAEGPRDHDRPSVVSLTTRVHEALLREPASSPDASASNGASDGASTRSSTGVVLEFEFDLRQLDTFAAEDVSGAARPWAKIDQLAPVVPIASRAADETLAEGEGSLPAVARDGEKVVLRALDQAGCSPALIARLRRVTA